MSAIATVLFAALVLGSSVYCILVVVAVRRYRSVTPERLSIPAPISIISPVAGMEEGLEGNLRSFFEEDYPEFEILFAARNSADPALAVVRKLIAEFPQIPARIIITGEPPYPNAKVFSLVAMIREARHDLVLMKDSDVRSHGSCLSAIAAEFQDEEVRLATCPYRAVAIRGLWWKLDEVGLNTSFWGGVVVARMLHGMDFALGPAIAARKTALERIGGIGMFGDYLAEDFLLGKTMQEKERGVILSSYCVEHHFGGGDLRGNFRHRLRWYRSSRRSRRLGYIGELFTYTLPLAAGLVLVNARWWPLATAAALLRGISGWIASTRVARAAFGWREFLLFPVDDFVRFGFWIMGFFGDHITWRGRTFVLTPDGRIHRP